jgi:stage II sporulation protein D
MSFFRIGHPNLNCSKLFGQIFLLGTLSLLLITQPGCKTRQFIRPTPQMNTESRFWVRVLLLDNVTECTVKSTSSLNVTNTGLCPQTLTSQVRLETIDEPTKIELQNSRITIAGQPFMGSILSVCPDVPHIFSINGDEYRGKLEIIINPDGNSFDVINFIPLEPYLAGVVGAEMPDYWEPEALKAQAIAARTYCLYIKKRFGENRNWDISKTQANQVYAGVKAESAQIWDVINKTYGQVLVCRHHDGNEDIFPTYYSSVCGGHTENSEHVFGDSFEPLAGVVCPYCKDVAKLTFFFWPMAQIDKTTITNRLFQRYPKLKRLGEITDILPSEQSEYGTFSRLTKIKIAGSTGQSDFLRAEDFRLAIDPTGRQLKSTSCLIIKWDGKWAFLAGKGWGHGVGMCQHGAEGLARDGKTASQILQYYYPGSTIVTVY